jgi:hypothetical protein
MACTVTTILQSFYVGPQVAVLGFRYSATSYLAISIAADGEHDTMQPPRCRGVVLESHSEYDLNVKARPVAWRAGDLSGQRTTP